MRPGSGAVGGCRPHPTAGACPPLLLLLIVVAPAWAQEPAPRDTTGAPSAVADSLGQEAVADSLDQEAEERIQAFPERRSRPAGSATPVYECDHACIQASPSLTLIELLIERVPGLTPLRAGYYGGSHYALHGPFGPGFLELHLDGQPLTSLEAGEADILRLSLVYVERLRVFRRPDGFVVDVWSRRQDEPTAYSRISGGTGSPDVQLLNAIFTNRLGGSFTVGAAFDLLETALPTGRNDRFDFWGRVSWMPRSNDFGLQLDYRSESLDRSAADTVDYNRRDLVLRTRFDLSRLVQVTAWAGSASLRAEDSTLRDADQFGAEVTAAAGRGEVSVRGRLGDGGAYPELEGRLRGGYEVAEWLELDAGAGLGKWEEFSTSEFRGAVRASFDALIPITLRADGATGTRGVPRPVRGEADSVSFDALSASVEFEVGPFRVSGRYGSQSLERQLPFGAPFDSLLSERSEVDLRAWEVSFSGPVLPLGWIADGLNPLRVSGFYRRHDLPGEDPPLYVPEDLLHARLTFHDSFFSGNLGVWVTGSLVRRGSTLSARSRADEPELLSPYSWWGGHVMIKIADFRLFYKLENPTGAEVAEVIGVPFPSLVSVFGVRWEFFN